MFETAYDVRVVVIQVATLRQLVGATMRFARVATIPLWCSLGVATGNASRTSAGGGARTGTTAWKFAQYYPRHYVNLKLQSHEHIVVDGRLDDVAWDAADWTEDFVDITHHNDSALNAVPRAFQTRVKMRWDADYLYIGAELNEPFLFGNITGHNLVAPYHDNDFEVFIDVSSSTHYYKEYEMNMLNATYDINCCLLYTSDAADE